MDLSGRLIGHYRVAEELSRGGMGIVYRATDVRLNRDVALKVLPPELMHDADRRRRFVQEAQAASAIEHPNIAVIYDVDEADGHTFIAMELVHGLKMSDWLARGRPPLAQALDLASEIASGVGRAHERQIVHRDLKPANVMVTDDGHAKVIDFGIAKLIEPAATANDVTRGAGNTGAGVVLGTMTYMSPEQARGDHVDHRSDIFSFGIMFFEMLSGQPPFQGKSGLETAGAILNAATPRLPPAASSAAIDLTADLQRIVDKCLEKDAANRYQGMKDLIVDLRAAKRRLESGTQPTVAHAPSSPARTGSRMKVVAAGIAIVALAGAAAIWWPRRSPESAPVTGTSTKPSVAVLYFDNSSGVADLDWLRTGITEMVVTDLSQSPDLEVIGTDRLYSVLASMRRADDKILSPEVVAEVASRTGVDHVVVGSYMKAGDAVRINLRLQDVKTGRILSSERVEGPSTSNLFQMVDDLTRRIRAKFLELRPAGIKDLVAKPGAGTLSDTAGGLDRGLGDVTTSSIEAYRHYAEGINLHERSRPAEAAPLFEKAIQLDPSFAMAYAKLAVVQNNLGRLDLRDKYASLAIKHADRLTPRERFYIEGYFYSGRADTLARSIEAYSKCVELDGGHQGCRHNLALQLILLERFQEGIGHYEELIRRGTTNPTTYSNLATAYLQLGQPDKALATTEAFAKRNPESAGAHFGVGLALLGAGRYEEAVQAFGRGEVLDPSNSNVILGKGVAQILRHDWAAADAIAASLSTQPDQTRRWFGAFLQFATAMYRGRCDEALRAEERALAAYKVPGPRTAVTRRLVAPIRGACGSPPEVLADVVKAVDEAKGDVEERFALGELAAAQASAGRFAEADATLSRLEQSIDPIGARDNRTLAFGRGRVALARKNVAAAIEHLERAQASLSPSSGHPLVPTFHVAIWYSLAEAYLAAGRLAEAERWFDRISRSGTERSYTPVEFVRSFYHLGKIREARGDAAAAQDAYRRFVGFWKDGTVDRARVAEAERKLR